MLLVFALFCTAVTVFRPGYLTDSGDLGGLIFLQVIIAAVWKFRQTYFAMLLIAFLLAGIDSPLASPFTTGRWVVLAVGALVGFAIYMRDRTHYFTGFHLMALFCVLAALASVVVSSYPRVAMLKTTSLLLLFLYCAAGARLAIVGRERAFFSGLLIGCEIATYVAAVWYFVIRYDILGNPNSLGAVMGIIIIPMLLWGIQVTEAPLARQRRTVALFLALVLLLSSFARAGFTAAAVAFVFLCFGLRQYRLLLKGSLAALLLALLVLAVLPPPEDQGEASRTVVSSFIYKGKRDMGLLGSRRTAWQQTMSVIQQNPWFGSGFGTSLTGVEERMQALTLSSAPQATREHGNSYLAILEWVGLLGVVPFIALVFLVSRNSIRVLLQLRRTADPHWAAVPIAMILAAGVAHAAFEDWMFAAGYYMCPLFWTMAFVCIDFLPRSAEPADLAMFRVAAHPHAISALAAPHQ
jgi:O-antigen ligase